MTAKQGSGSPQEHAWFWYGPEGQNTFLPHNCTKNTKSPQEDGCAALILGTATGAQPATPFDSISIEKFVKKYWNELRVKYANEGATRWFMQSDLPHHRLTRTEIYRLNAVDYARKALVARHYVEQLQQYNGTYSAMQKELRIVLRDASYRAKMAYRNAH